MEQLNEQDELLTQLLALKQNPAFRFYISTLERWKAQALEEILNAKECESEKGEVKAFGRAVALVDKLIYDMTHEGGENINLDAYVDIHKTKPQGTAA